ncbi:ribosome-releasing factor 2, mitochondrial-like [Mizuhopecten yessoensis]|uniref:Ribosome-releasing factor 2, mitochondrial n=1 Tax=Mizuhopecten yessoensis TaxID=6573 RepID=A0A210QIY2_MIZYE|nr:ribosome-releasing factor 2, mitochondrial-like [Mizuhopecten yessoensis]OWF48725.1 Ribosome-releasing factor 2, mitochondrial [Mizuhopecten yessoensis]
MRSCLFTSKPAHLLRTLLWQRCPVVIQHRLVFKLSKSEETNRIRNIGIIAHIDAGKTTTTERMLFYSGFSEHLGSVDDGDTVTDYMDQERERGITITSAAVTFDWNKHRVNLLDTPGHIDFTVEVERCLRVLDGTITVLDAAAGVEAQTLTVWRQANRYKIPSIMYLNKMDKPHADFQQCLQSIEKKLHVKAMPIFVPVSCDRNTLKQIDVVGKNLLTWDLKESTNGRKFDIKKISPDVDKTLWENLINWRTSMVETLADFDLKLEEHVLSDTPIADVPAIDLVRGLRRATLDRHVVPVLGGSSLRNMGIQPLIDSVCLYLPNPSDRNFEFTKFYGEDLCALVFKIIHHKERGTLTFLRVYNGSIKAKANLFNMNQNLSEKVTRLLQIYADDFQEILSSGPGTIVCVTGLKSSRTGDTITSSQSAANRARKTLQTLQEKELRSKGHQVTQSSELSDEDSHDDDDTSEAILAGMQIPTPVFFCSIEPPSTSSQRKMEMALECLQREDPSLQVEYKEETTQTILSGMGELHLEVIKNRIIKEFKVDVDLGPLQVAYREAISGKDIVQKENLNTRIGNQHHTVNLTMAVSHNPDAEKFTHIKIVNSEEAPSLQTIRRKYIKAIENGVKAALSGGPVLGYPVIDVEVSLLDFSMMRGTSLPMISACASQCVRHALEQAGPKLQEPFMKVEISTEEEWLSNILKDLSMRRGEVESIHYRDGVRLIEVLVPLVKLRGYSSDLRRISSGSATFVMELATFRDLSFEEEKKVIDKATGFSS